jgi:hypothetical protein
MGDATITELTISKREVSSTHHDKLVIKGGPGEMDLMRSLFDGKVVRFTFLRWDGYSEYTVFVRITALARNGDYYKFFADLLRLEGQRGDLVPRRIGCVTGDYTLYERNGWLNIAGEGLNLYDYYRHHLTLGYGGYYNGSTVAPHSTAMIAS